MKPIIRLSGLSKVYLQEGAPFQALDQVSLEVLPGEIFGVIGLSGAGKSTLVRCVNLLESPDAGIVEVEGQDLTRLSPAQLRFARRKISMIFQGFHLLMQRTCLENVQFPLELEKVPSSKARKRALELLELVGLADKANAYPARLSGGQKQRVAIARALATQPRVLLCDEATSALDPTTTTAILELLQDINRRLGVTVVIITHQMEVIERICTRVAILDQGRVAEQGAVAEIFRNPKTDAARRLVYPAGVPAELPQENPVIRLSFDGGAAYQPIVSSLALECGVKANILAADLRPLEGKTFGTMLLELPDDPAARKKALSYLTAQPHLTCEEVKPHA